jgi:metallo-beta-lactamase class B
MKTSSSAVRAGLICAASIAFAVAPSLVAQTVDTVRVAYPAVKCASCVAWNEPRSPFKIFGNTYYVGTAGLSSILITSANGHVLIDGALPLSAPLIEANIRALGFRVEDVRLILNSHAHYDHAGGIAAIQRASGARVAALPWSAEVLERGESDKRDPQFGVVNPFPPVRGVQRIRDDETLRVGSLALAAHLTAGHTPSGTSWTWQSCEQGRCVNILYADSQSPVSADSFYFTHNATYPTAESDFMRGLSVLEQLPCDILLTPHPGVSSFFDRVAARDSGSVSALVDPALCKRVVDSARRDVTARMVRERAAHDSSTR